MQEPKAGERIGGRYLLVERLGMGGMGEVWLAVHEGSGTFRRKVVVKFVPPEKADDDRLANMLADEARILGLLHHPGIVAPVDYVDTDGSPVLVLEHIDGPSLRTALRGARRNRQIMPETLAAWVGAEVARALHAAHQATDEGGKPLNLIHRDVSPDNVLFSRDGRVHLLDFGVARAAGNSDVTMPGSAPKGKRGYMPPEQAAGLPLGPSADVFALGRVVAEAADVNCSAELRTVLDKATADKAKVRFQTAAEFADALGEVCRPPADPSGAVATWLHAACPDQLGPRGTTSPAQGQSTPPGATHPSASPSSGRFRLNLETGHEVRNSSQPPPHQSQPPPPATPHHHLPPPPHELFEGVAQRRSGPVRVIAALLVLIGVGLPLALFAEARGLHLEDAPLLHGLHAPHGQLLVRSRPEAAEVYIDGSLRGVTPLQLEVTEGKHAVRVGSLRLEKWRAEDVVVKESALQQVDVDLTE